EGRITLSQAAPSGGVRLFIVSSDADVIVPATVTVPAGTTSATFDIRTGPVAALKDVQVTVSAAPVSARAVGRMPRTAAGEATFTLLITVLPGAPTLTSLSPASGVQGSTVAVTLTGTKFSDGATVAVTGTCVTVDSVTVTSATSITAALSVDADASPGARSVTVTTAGGTTGARPFTVTALPPSAPSLASVAPAFALRGTSTEVALAGTNFIDGATVAVDGTGVTVS